MTRAIRHAGYRDTPDRIVYECCSQVNRIQDGYVGAPASVVSSNLLNALSDMSIIEEGGIEGLLSPSNPTMLGRLLAKIRPGKDESESNGTPAEQLWRLACDVLADILSTYLDVEEPFASSATDRVVEKLVRPGLHSPLPISCVMHCVFPDCQPCFADPTKQGQPRRSDRDCLSSSSAQAAHRAHAQPVEAAAYIASADDDQRANWLGR